MPNLIMILMAKGFCLCIFHQCGSSSLSSVVVDATSYPRALRRCFRLQRRFVDGQRRHYGVMRFTHDPSAKAKR
eukprot:3544008-Pleurochrysis_carterae.AAC.1